MSSSGASPLFSLLAAAALGSVVFGEYAQEISKWLVCAHAAWQPGDQICDGSPRTEALMIGTFVSTVVAIFAAATAGSFGQKPYRDAVLSVIAALAGAFFALLKAAAAEKNYPDPAQLAWPLFIYAAIVILLLLPFGVVRVSSERYARATELQARIALALLIGVALGWMLQGAAELLWTGTHDGYSSRKFIVAPSVTVAGVGAWCSAMLAPALAKRQTSLQWPVASALLAVLLVSVFAGILYFGKHGTGWLSKAHATRIEVIVLFNGLLLPGIASAALALIPCRRLKIRGRLFLFTIPASVVAAGAAWGSGMMRVQAAMMEQVDMSTLVGVHMLATLGVTLTVLMSDNMHRLLYRLFVDNSRMLAQQDSLNLEH